MKQASFASSIVHGGGKRRAEGMQRRQAVANAGAPIHTNTEAVDMLTNVTTVKPILS